MRPVATTMVKPYLLVANWIQMLQANQPDTVEPGGRGLRWPASGVRSRGHHPALSPGCDGACAAGGGGGAGGFIFQSFNLIGDLPGQLSGGQQQGVAVARAVVGSSPSILLCCATRRRAISTRRPPR